MDDLQQVDQSGDQIENFGIQNEGNFDRSTIKNFKGFDPNMLANRLSSAEVETSAEEKLERRTLERATLSPFTSGEKFFNEIKSQYTQLKQAYISNCGGKDHASPEVLQAIDAKLGNENDDAGIKCSSYWQRRAEVQDFKDIIKMYNLDLCGRSLWRTYNEEPDGSLLPKELKTIFDKAVSSETPVDINNFELDMNRAINEHNTSLIEKYRKELSTKQKCLSNDQAKYLDDISGKAHHILVDEETMRRQLGLETGFISKDISKLKDGLKDYPVLGGAVSYKLSNLKRHGKSSSLRTEAKRIMNRAYQIKAQLDELTRLDKNENNSENRISLGRCKEFENKLILLFNKSANNDKDFTAGLNEIKAEINKEKVLIENEIYIYRTMEGFINASSLNEVRWVLQEKLRALGKNGSVELSKNKDAEKLIKRAERVADEIKKLEKSGLEKIEIPTEQDDVNQAKNKDPFIKDFEESLDNSANETKKASGEDQNSVKKTKKDAFKEQLEDVFENHANEKDFDRELNKVLVGINQAEISADNEGFIKKEVGEFDEEVNGFYAGISDNQDDNENQASSARGEYFATKTLSEALGKFATNNKGEVVKLSGRRGAAGATGVLNRAKQITDTLKSLKEHLTQKELTLKECMGDGNENKGFVDELNELYSELATARGFGRKLKAIEAKINKAVAVNVAEENKKRTITNNKQYIQGQINNLEDQIGGIKEQAQKKHSDLNIGLKDATAEGGLKEIFQSKLKALNDGSVDFANNTGAQNNIQRMYDKTKVAVTYLKHIESGRNRGLLTGKEYDKYKKEFKACFSDSLGRPRESAEAFEARLKKIYAGAKKLRKERISNDYDTIGGTINNIGLHLQLSQVKEFAQAVFKADGEESQGFIDALAKLKESANISDENTQEDDGQLRELLGNKARELARTHFVGGKGSRKEFENKLGVLLSRAQEIQKTINTYKEKNSNTELNPKKKQQLFKLMAESLPKVYLVKDDYEDVEYVDGKFESGLEKFEMDVGIRERPKRRGLFGLRNPKEVVVEQNSTEDSVIGIYDDLGSNQNENPIWADQSEPINDNKNQDEDDFNIHSDFEESWGDSVI